MYEYRQTILRMRQGATDRAVSRSGLMGRRKAREVRETARVHGWLECDAALPDDGELAKVFARQPASSSISPLSKHHDVIKRWGNEGFQTRTIQGHLKPKHSYRGSYSSVRRYVNKLRGPRVKATVRLEFAPGEAAQVDFGTGPKLPDPVSGELRSTWIFVMTLCW